MPTGDDATDPAPVPANATVSKYPLRVNVAVTDFAVSMLTTHAPVPVHAPDQPANVDPTDGVAVRVTVVP